MAVLRTVAELVKQNDVGRPVTRQSYNGAAFLFVLFVGQGSH